MSDPIENWQDERQSAFLYAVLSEVERVPRRQTMFVELRQAALTQADLWAQEAARGGRSVPEFRTDARTRLVAWLTRRLGVRAMRPVLTAMKVRGMSMYLPVPGHPMPLDVEEIGRRHSGIGGGNLRAAVFGVNDGLLSNLSLILGVAAAGSSASTILLTGIAGLLAGAFSMAAGEFVSVRSQREMYEYQIGLERSELAQYPREEAAELALIYLARGMSRQDADRLATELISDPARALDALTREELGLNPEDLGSPWGAAGFSFFAFAIGGLIPLVPFMLGRGPNALYAAMGLSGLALFGVGAALSLFTGRSALAGGGRMLAIGAAVGGTTYLVGRLLGVSLG